MAWSSGTAPSRVPEVRKMLDSARSKSVGLCTVIGFPNGYATTESKIFEMNDFIIIAVMVVSSD